MGLAPFRPGGPRLAVLAATENSLDCSIPNQSNRRREPTQLTAVWLTTMDVGISSAMLSAAP